MICPNCDSENRAEAKYCDQCGFPLTGAIARAAQSLAESADAVEEPELVEFEEDSKTPDVADSEDPAETPDAPVPDEPAETPDAPGPDEPTEMIDAVEPDGPTETIDAVDPLEATGALDAAGQSKEEADAAGIDFVPAADEDPTVPLDDGADEPADMQETSKIDLAGFDVEGGAFGERVVSGGFAAPAFESRDGNTMQMPRIEENAAPKAKEYLARNERPKKRRRTAKIAAIVIACAAACAAMALFATYQFELWGGRAIPDVVGMTEADASDMLAEDGFSVRTTHVKSDGTEGLVLVMDPTAGTRADEGTEVVIHLAAARVIPDVKGKNQDDAAAMLEEEGFENVVMEDEKSDEPEDTVLSVDPEVGERAKSTQQVTVKIADPYVVPEIAGLDYDDAVAAVVNAGLAYDVARVNTVEYQEGYIMGSEPVAGSKVPGGSLVVIQVAHARGTELVDLTSALLAPGQTFFLNGHDYEIESLDSIEYIGNDTVSFGCTARPFASILGETVYVSARHVTGTVTWTSDNQVAGIS